MKLLFLGTGAADWPMEKTDNASEFRRFSSALVDDILLIDPGPQVIDTLHEQQKNLKAIRFILNTHKHPDHFSQETVRTLTALGAEWIELHAGMTKTFDRYTVSAYCGNHSTCPDTVHFILTDTQHTLFYGLDGAWLLYDEVQAIKRMKPDLAILDATIGDVEGDYRIFEHNNLPMISEIKKTLAPYVKTFCISHMARTLHTDHKTLSEKMSKLGILVAYDGLEIFL